MTSADKVFKEMEKNGRRLREKEGESDLKGTKCQLHLV